MPTIVTPDRRQASRILVNVPLIAKASISPSHSVIGLVLDISKFGLAFHYLETHDHLGLNSNIQLDLVSSELGAKLSNIPIRVVSDCQVMSGSTFVNTSLRKCAVQFTDLTMEHRSSLTALLFILPPDSPTPEFNQA
ncbi:MAG: hypothetical protein A2521_00255 [Deltaproteobacteria bacterium RIFOXYD12_FULL_57_12]|nr:MAG: hypothetical protein A2521_00255 [Deltaproteobacteria bacterium RIFOXYD12_FULL_57_12]